MACSPAHSLSGGSLLSTSCRARVHGWGVGAMNDIRVVLVAAACAAAMAAGVRSHVASPGAAPPLRVRLLVVRAGEAKGLAEALCGALPNVEVAVTVEPRVRGRYVTQPAGQSVARRRQFALLREALAKKIGHPLPTFECWGTDEVAVYWGGGR